MAETKVIKYSLYCAVQNPFVSISTLYVANIAENSKHAIYLPVGDDSQGDFN